MDNTHLYKDSEFTITRELIINGNSRYALHHLCSIKLERAYRQFPYTLCVFGLILIVAASMVNFKFNSLVILLGALTVLGCVALVIFRKPVHKLYLVFSSGEKEAIENTDYAYLEGLASAISRALTRVVSQTTASITDEYKLTMKR
jgi:hypothetical protein